MMYQKNFIGDKRTCGILVILFLVSWATAALFNGTTNSYKIISRVIE